MRSKAKISNTLLFTKSLQRYLNLRQKLESIEKALKTSYDERRMNKERAVQKIPEGWKDSPAYEAGICNPHSQIRIKGPPSQL